MSAGAAEAGVAPTVPATPPTSVPSAVAAAAASAVRRLGDLVLPRAVSSRSLVGREAEPSGTGSAVIVVPPRSVTVPQIGRGDIWELAVRNTSGRIGRSEDFLPVS